MAESHGQAPAHAPGQEEATSKARSSALAPDNKPPDTTIAASTTGSQNHPPSSVAAPVGNAVLAVSQKVVAPHTSHNGKAAEVAAGASAPSKDQCAGPSATSKCEDGKMAIHDEDVAAGGKAAVDQQPGQPPGQLPGPHPQPPELAQTDHKRIDKQKRGVPKRKADDTGISTGNASETHLVSPADAHRKDGVGSTGQWSFYGE